MVNVFSNQCRAVASPQADAARSAPLQLQSEAIEARKLWLVRNVQQLVASPRSTLGNFENSTEELPWLEYDWGCP
jgi:hypothetical protein